MEGHAIGRGIEENKAFLEGLFWHMLGVVNLVPRIRTVDGRPVRWQEIGTGTACSYRGANFILTARHVLDDAGPSDLRFFPRASGRIEWADELGHRTRAVRVALDVSHIIRCGWEDLAAIVLPPGPAPHEGIRFCELPGNLSDPPDRAMCVVVGYPYDRTRPAETERAEEGLVHNLCARTDAFWSTIVDTDRLLSGFNRDSHFLLRFSPSFPGGRPDGYSGAGVWFALGGPGSRAVWSADPMLAGVQTHGYRESGLLRVVKASVVKAFIEEAFPTQRSESQPPHITGLAGRHP